MKILYLTTHYSLEPNHSWLVDTLAESMAKEHEVSVLFFDWSGKRKSSMRVEKNGVVVYVLPTGSWFYKSGFGKAMKWALVGRIFLLKNLRFLKEGQFDVVIGFTPALILSPIASYVKKKSKNAKAYLVLWDFFPDYHFQLGLLPKFLVPTLSLAERKAYSIYDYIGMMSPGNIRYFKENIGNRDNLSVLELWGPDVDAPSKNNVEIICKQSGLVSGVRLAVFGGQLIAGRGLNKVIELAQYAYDKKYKIKFFIYGDGPEKANLIDLIDNHGLGNIEYKGFSPRDEYLEVLKSAHIGLVFNSGHVAVPTYPSKAIDFFRAGVPILAYLEEVTDFGKILQFDIGAGFYSSPSEDEGLFKKFDLLMCMSDEELRAMGARGYNYYSEKMVVSQAKAKIFKAINVCRK